MKPENIKVTPSWSKSKEQIWAERFEALSDEPVEVEVNQGKRLNFTRRHWISIASAAAAIVVVFSSFALLYNKEVVAPKGTRLSLLLPDGSKVQLNAYSSVSYKPYSWKISRRVKMEGEAFFEVVKGSKFSVITPNGSVAVLGTSFNVIARGELFDVTCVTGRVEVTSANSSTLLTPGMGSTLQEGSLVSSEGRDADAITGWIKGEFSFSDARLIDVIEEIERQYNITIVAPKDLNYFYTGKFSMDKNPEEILQIIGKPFGITLGIK